MRIKKLAIFLLLITDRLTKSLALNNHLPLSKNTSLFFINLNQTQIIILSFIIMLTLTIHLIKFSDQQILNRGLLLILLGGASNLFDRLTHGYVIDWITTPISVLNLADLMIALGCLFITFQYILTNK